MRIDTLVLAAPSVLLLSLACSTPGESVEKMLAKGDAVRELPEPDRSRLMATHHPVTSISPEPPEVPQILTSGDARRFALQSSPDIHAARARLEAARTRIAESRSFYFPQIEAAHSANRTLQSSGRISRSLSSALSPTSPIPELPSTLTLFDLINTVADLSGRYFSPTSIGRANTNSFSDHSSVISVGWTLFDGFAREARLLSSKYSHQAAAMSMADAERLLIQAVDTAYHQWQFGLEQVRVGRADEQFSREQLADARRRLEAQKLTQADVLNFEVRVRAAQANVAAAEALRDTARIVLAELMALPDAHMPLGTEIEPLAEEAPEDLALPEVDAWLDVAMASRPDLVQAEHIVKAREQNIRLAKGQFSPELSLRGSWGFEQDSNIGYSRDDQTSAVGIELRWPIYTGGFRTAQLQRAHAEWWEAVSLLKRVRLAIAADVRGTAVDLANAQEQVRLQRENLASATENRELVRSQYAAGKASLVRLNEAQRDYVQTDADLARARIDLRQAWTDLEAAAGTYHVPATP